MKVPPPWDSSQPLSAHWALSHRKKIKLFSLFYILYIIIYITLCISLYYFFIFSQGVRGLFPQPPIPDYPRTLRRHLGRAFCPAGDTGGWQGTIIWRQHKAENPTFTTFFFFFFSPPNPTFWEVFILLEMQGWSLSLRNATLEVLEMDGAITPPKKPGISSFPAEGRCSHTVFSPLHNLICSTLSEILILFVRRGEGRREMGKNLFPV